MSLLFRSRASGVLTVNISCSLSLWRIFDSISLFFIVYVSLKILPLEAWGQYDWPEMIDDSVSDSDQVPLCYGMWGLMSLALCVNTISWGVCCVVLIPALLFDWLFPSLRIFDWLFSAVLFCSFALGTMAMAGRSFPSVRNLPPRQLYLRLGIPRDLVATCGTGPIHQPFGDAADPLRTRHRGEQEVHGRVFVPGGEGIQMVEMMQSLMMAFIFVECRMEQSSRISLWCK